MNRISFKGIDCAVFCSNYDNGRKCISVIDASNGNGICHATVNISALPLEDNDVLIKDYDECEGLYQILVNNYIITHAEEVIQYGNRKVFKCKILI